MQAVKIRKYRNGLLILLKYHKHRETR